MYIGQSKAIPFIIKDAKDKYIFTEQAIQFLSTLDAPLSIVTVAGLYRTGKSYLLNRVILNKSDGFGVGPTVNPCTKGLWLWAQAIRCDGKNLLVVDTEGLGALDEQSNHDMKIFSLAVLLSSNFIYNSVGSIDENALQTLGLALNLLQTIDIENKSLMPSLLWVVRDFSLQLVNDKGMQITSSQYLQMALNCQNLKQQQKIQLRKSILSSFSQRQCCTLVKPLIDQNMLQNLDKIPPQDLRPEFVSQTVALRKYIMNNLREMRLGNKNLTGKDYVIMVKQYINAINTGHMPDLLDTWSYIKMQKSRAAVDQVRYNYNQKLRVRIGNKIPMQTAKLHQILQILRRQAIEQYKLNSYEQLSNPDLQQFLQAAQNELKKANSKQNRNLFNQFIKKQYDPFQRKLLSQYYVDLISFQNDLRQFFIKSIVERYQQRIDIPTIQLQLFVQKRLYEAAKIFQRKAKQQTNRIKQIKQESEISLQNQIRNATKSVQQERRRMQQQILNLERKIIFLTAQKQKIQQTSQKQQRQETQQLQKWKKKIQQYHNSNQGLQMQINRLISVNSDQQKTLFQARKDLQKEKALTQQKLLHLTQKNQQMQKKIYQQTSQLDRLNRLYDIDRKQITNNFELQFKNLINENKQLKDYIQDISHQIQRQKQQKNNLFEELNQIKIKYTEQIANYKERISMSNKKQSRVFAPQLQQKIQTLQIQLKQSNTLCHQLQNKTKKLTEQIKIIKQNNQKTQAISAQKIQFQQIQINQLRIKNKQLNQIYHKYLQSSHLQSRGNEQLFKKKLSQIQIYHQRTIKDISEQYNFKTRQLNNKINQLEKSYKDIEDQLTSERKTNSLKQKQLRQQIKRAQIVISQTQNRLIMAEKGHAQMHKQKQSYFQVRVKQLQKQIDQIKDKTSRQMQQQTRKAQQSLQILKKYSQDERKQWQRRLRQQQQKNSKNIKEIMEEATHKLQQQKQQYEHHVQQLTHKLQQQQRNYQNKIQTLIADYQIKIQKINNNTLEERKQLTRKLAITVQDAELVRGTLQGQLDERIRSHNILIQNVKREMKSQFQKQILSTRQLLQNVQNKYITLQKSSRKTQQTNFQLIAQIDKQKSLSKQKIQELAKQLRQLQERYFHQIEQRNNQINILQSQHTFQLRNLNITIQKLTTLNGELERDNMTQKSTIDSQRNAYASKIRHCQEKQKRLKNQYQALLKQFETTVTAINARNNKKDLQNEFAQKLQKHKQDYQKRLNQKEEQFSAQIKEKQIKINRLQIQNKGFRDRILQLQVKDQYKKGRQNDHFFKQTTKMQDNYQRKIQGLTYDIQDLAKQNQWLKSQLQRQSNIERSGNSRLIQPQQRQSFVISEYDNSRILRQNKSTSNFKNVPTTTIKKYERSNKNDEYSRYA